jgi:AcrR family transcriptional regulator
MYILLVSLSGPCYACRMVGSANDNGWRGSADVWLAAAHDIFLESGIDAVKILPLATKLNLSRTSFYWFFKDREELLSALIKIWREKNTGGIAKQAGAYAETISEAVLNVSDCWFDNSLFDPKLEFAVRSWALQSKDVQAEVEAADQQRLAALADMFKRFGHDDTSADVRSRTIYLIQIGYISMQTSEPLALRMKRIPTYIEVFTDLTPEPRELARFYARHGHPDQKIGEVN